MKELYKKIKIITENHDHILFIEGFEDALIGVGRHSGYPVAIYDECMCIEILAKQMSFEKALEYLNENIDECYIGESAPVFLECNI